MAISDRHFSNILRNISEKEKLGLKTRSTIKATINNNKTLITNPHLCLLVTAHQGGFVVIFNDSSDKLKLLLLRLCRNEGNDSLHNGCRLNQSNSLQSFPYHIRSHTSWLSLLSLVINFAGTTASTAGNFSVTLTDRAGFLFFLTEETRIGKSTSAAASVASLLACSTAMSACSLHFVFLLHDYY